MILGVLSEKSFIERWICLIGSQGTGEIMDRRGPGDVGTCPQHTPKF